MTDTYLIENERLRVEIPATTMSLRVIDKATGFPWQMSEESHDEVVMEEHGAIAIRTLADSQRLEVRQLGPAAILLEYADFRLQLLLVAEQNRLLIQITPLEENEQFRIKGLMYPRSFALSRSPESSLILPEQQGLMIPGDWPEEIEVGEIWPFDDEQRLRTFGELFDVDVNWWSSLRPGYSPSLFNRMLMPWWGGVDRGHSFLAVLDEECWPDSHLWVRNPRNGPPQVRLLWLPSWGRLSFPRRLTFHFYEGGDYVSLCKEYRKIAEDRGKCLTLRDKNEKNPTVGRLAGATNTTLRFLAHSHKQFHHEVLKTFTQGAETVEAFTQRTGLHLHVAARSWQQRGHDIQYPDLVPPAPDCGGPVEFDAMAARIQKLGHVFGLGGDNYHDVSMESPLYDESMLLRFADGSTNRRNFWASGLTSMVCAATAMKYLRRNFEVGRTDYPDARGLLDTAHPDTYWIGNYVSSYECYDPRHPCTRTGYWEAQRDIFQYVNERGLLLNNEHPMDWAAPWFYMARTRQAREGVYGYDRSGDVIGVPVPLWSLVFHDCLITGGDDALLQMMNGSPGTIDLDQCTDRIVERVRTHGKLHAAVCYEPMTGHAFESEDRTVQRAEFANGVAVTIDQARGQARIDGVSGVEGDPFEVVAPGKNFY